MKKIGCITLIFIVIVVTGIYYLAKTLTTEIDSEVEKIETLVGERIILKNDTLLIMDYSILNSNYTLEDGREISFELAKKLKCVPKDK